VSMTPDPYEERWVSEIAIGPGRRISVRPRRVRHSDLKADPAAVENAARRNAPRLLFGSLEKPASPAPSSRETDRSLKK
jgi:hypothetical protein